MCRCGARSRSFVGRRHRQIRDGFRAAGYLDADVETLARTIRQRIAALEAL